MGGIAGLFLGWIGLDLGKNLDYSLNMIFPLWSFVKIMHVLSHAVKKAIIALIVHKSQLLVNDYRLCGPC